MSDNKTAIKHKPSPNPDQLLTEKEAASILCYSQRALQNWRLRGGGPEYVKVSARSIRYQMRDLMKWIEDRKRKHTAQMDGPN